MLRHRFVWAALSVTALSVPAAAGAQGFRSESTFSLGGTTSPVEQPDIAYDSNNNQYLQVVGKGFIEAHLLNASGAILRTFNVTDSGLYAQNPRVTFSPDVAGGGGYLVTWHASIGDIGRVRGRIFNAPGDAVTGEFDIATSATSVALSTQWTMGAPSAYANGSKEFLVVWGGNKYTTFDILAQRVNTSGTLLGANMLISGGGSDLYDRDPSVAYNPTNDRFVVGWGVYNEAGQFGFSSSRSVQAGVGSLGTLQNYGSARGVSITSIAYNATANQFLFAWHNQTSTSQFHYGLLLDANGNAASDIRVMSAFYAAYDALDIEFNAPSGEYFLITHGQNWEDAGVTIKGDGNAYDNGFLVTSTTGVNGNFHPRLATSTVEKKWLVVTASGFLRTAAQFVASNATGVVAPPPPAPPATCSYDLSVSAEIFGALGGVGGFTLTTGDSCSWTAGSNAPWLTLDSASIGGTGSKRLTFTVAVNQSRNERTGIIYIGNRSVTVTQTGRTWRKTDFNGDGRNDLIWQNRLTGELAIWRMDGINMMSSGYLNPANVGDTNWKILGTLDANLDGQTDLLFQHDAGYVAIWRMSGETWVKVEMLSLSVVSEPQWRIAGTGDMDRDGFSDIIWQHADGRVAVWYLWADGLQVRETAVIAWVSDPRFRVAGIEDFNRDGKLDIVWRHSSSGEMSIWHMDDRQYLSHAAINRVVGNMEWQIEATADFSGDGKPDFIWRNSRTGELAAWFMDGATYLSDWPLNPGRVDPNWYIGGPR